MKTKAEDEGIRAVRDIRTKISAEWSNDPKKIIEHYIVEQQRYRSRLLRPAAAQQGDPVDDACIAADHQPVMLPNANEI